MVVFYSSRNILVFFFILNPSLLTLLTGSIAGKVYKPSLRKTIGSGNKLNLDLTLKMNSFSENILCGEMKSHCKPDCRAK